MNLMPFIEALEFFRKKAVLTGPQFEALAAEIGDYVNSLAFTVNQVAAADILQDVYDEVLKAIDAGGTFWDFREGIDDIMARRGWTGLAPYRLDNIFRTNIQTAYSVGRYKQMMAIAERRPYWQYDAVNDSRTRPSHLAHDGKVYHHLHPFWDTWLPSNGFRCRCRVNSLSAKEMEEEGLKEEKTGTSLKPDPGFQTNFAKEPWKPDLKKYHPQLKDELRDLGIEGIYD
jgi:SPP1 gp7 family putative phage head morphogenesis protein